MGLSNQGPHVLMEVMVENQDETEDGNQDEMEFETESKASNEEDMVAIICFHFTYFFYHRSWTMIMLLHVVKHCLVLEDQNVVNQFVELVVNASHVLQIVLLT